MCFPSGGPGRIDASLKSKGGSGRQCPSSKTVRQEAFPDIQGRVSIFGLFRPSTDWMRPTTLERASCFPQSTDSNVILIQNYLHRITFGQMTGLPMDRWHKKLAVTTYMDKHLKPKGEKAKGVLG